MGTQPIAAPPIDLDEALDRISKDVSSTLTLDEVLNRAMVDIAGALNAEMAAVHLLEGDELVVRYVHGAPLVPLGFRMDRGRSRLSFRAIDSKEIVYLENVTTDPDHNPRMAEMVGARALIIVPLVLHGECIGTLNIASSRERQSFSDDERNFVRRLSGYISLAIENARLFHSTQEKEARYRALFDNLPLPSGVFEVMIDGQGAIVDAKIVGLNLPGLRDMGVSGLQEVSGKRLTEMLQPNEASFLIDLLSEARSSGPVVNKEIRIKYDGRSYILSVFPIDDKHVGITGVNVTEMKETARQAEEERSRLQTILDTLPVGVGISDAGGKVVKTNAMIDEIWRGKMEHPRDVGEYSRFRAWRTDTGEPVAPEEWGTYQALKHGVTTTDEILDIQRFDGTKGRIVHSSAPIKGNDGQIIGAVGVIQDITDQMAAEERLKESETKYRRLVETALEGMWMIDGNYRTTFANHRMAEMLGYSVDEMLGRIPIDFMFPEDLEKIKEIMAKRVEGRSAKYEQRFRHRDGSEVWFIASAVPILGEDGSFQGSFAMFTDITDRKRTEALNDLLRSVNTEVLATPHLDEMLGAVMARVTEALQADRTTLSLLEGNELVVRYSHGPTPTKIGLRFTEEQGRTTFQVVRTGEPVVVEDAENDPRVNADFCRRTSSIAFITMPLVLKGRSIGVLSISYARPRSFSHREVDFANKLATTLSLAIENARLFGSVSRSEAKYRGLFKNLHEAVVLRRLILDEQGEVVDREIIDANPAALKALKAGSLAEVKGKRDSELYSPAIVAYVLDIARRVRATGVPVTEEGHFDIDDRDYLTTYAPLGKDHILSSSVDVTEAKRAQRESEELSKFLESIVASSPEGIMVLDGKELRVKVVNDFYKINFLEAPYNRMDLVGMRIFDFIPGVEDSQVPELLRIVALTGRPFVANEFEFHGFKRGTTYWNIAYFPIGPEDDRDLLVTAIEVTSQVEARKVLEEDRSRLRTILDTLPVGVFIADSSGRIVETNDLVNKIWGGEAPMSEGPEEYIEYKGWWPSTGKRIKAEEWALARAVQKGETSIGEIIDIERFDGSRGTILESTAPIKDEKGKIAGAVVTIEDITQQRQLEESLARSNAELQQFAYVASHDLREPLRMVSNYLDLLRKRYKNKVLDERAEEYMAFAVDGAVRMQQMINDLLTYSRIETRGDPFAPVRVAEVLDTVIRNLAKVIEENDAVINSERLPAVVADQGQMVQLFQNLVENAIKYRGPRPPVIQISATLQGGDWLFSVQDNGIGIPRDQQGRLFQMFSRLHTRDEYPGTGIGLAIAKKIVERHGGHIWVESEEGKGSTFYFTIPVRAA